MINERKEVQNEIEVVMLEELVTQADLRTVIIHLIENIYLNKKIILKI